MELLIEKENVSLMNCVFETSVVQEETMEMIVPDSKPDMSEIIDTDALIYMTAKDVDAGRAVISGKIEASVIYTAEGSSAPIRLQLSIPFTAFAASAAITSDCGLVASCTVSSADASALNPRKFLVRVSVLTEMTCYGKAEIQIPKTVSGDGIFTYSKKETVKYCAEVCEKTFVISDEIEQITAANVLKYDLSNDVTGINSIGSKAVIRGCVTVGCVYLSDGQPIRKEKVIDFSQMFEADGGEEGSEYFCSIMLTAAYFDASENSGGSVLCELHYVAQIVRTEQREIEYLADMFSISRQSQIEYVLIPVPAVPESESQTVSIDKYLSQDTDAVYYNLNSVKCGKVTLAEENGQKKYTGTLSACAAYTNADGAVKNITKTFEAVCDAPSGRVSKCTLRCTKCAFSRDGGGLRFAATCEFVFTYASGIEISAPVSASLSDENDEKYSQRPSIILHRKTSADTAWSLSKKCLTTGELICAANGAETFAEIPDNTVMLIPRYRA